MSSNYRYKPETKLDRSDTGRWMKTFLDRSKCQIDADLERVQTMTTANEFKQITACIVYYTTYATTRDIQRAFNVNGGTQDIATYIRMGYLRLKHLLDNRYKFSQTLSYLYVQSHAFDDNVNSRCTRLYNGLRRRGIDNFDQFMCLTYEQLKSLRNIGETSIQTALILQDTARKLNYVDEGKYRDEE